MEVPMDLWSVVEDFYAIRYSVNAYFGAEGSTRLILGRRWLVGVDME